MSVAFAPNALTNSTRCRPIGGGTGGDVVSKTFGVAASQTIKEGDFVSLSSGVVAMATVAQSIALGSTNNEVIASGGNLPIIGMALSDITTGADATEAITGRTTIQVAMLKDNEFLLRTVDPAHDVDLDGSTAEVRDTAVGTSYQFGIYRVTATDWFYTAIITTTNGELRQVEKYPSQAAADDWGLAWYRAIQSDTVIQSA
jgi:hypothetical protein